MGRRDLEWPGAKLLDRCVVPVGSGSQCSDQPDLMSVTFLEGVRETWLAGCCLLPALPALGCPPPLATPLLDAALEERLDPVLFTLPASLPSPLPLSLSRAATRAAASASRGNVLLDRSSRARFLEHGDRYDTGIGARF